MFLRTLEEACGKTGWRIHAFVLMPNHYHLVLETPEPNLVAGMRWLQGTYTTRFNRRHGLVGHLFQGRYKAISIDPDSGSYLQTACRYVHLNPVRAGLISAKEVAEYPWSSAALYAASNRPAWMCVERVLGELGLEDDRSGRRRYREHLEALGAEERVDKQKHAADYAGLRRGWAFGASDFRERLLERLTPGKSKRRSHSGGAAEAHDEDAARRLIAAELKQLNISLDTLRKLRWTAPEKRRVARVAREQTTVTNAWIASYLGGGSEASVSRAASRHK